MEKFIFIKQLIVITQPILTEIKMFLGVAASIGTIVVSRSEQIHEAVDYIGDIGVILGAFGSLCLAVGSAVKLYRTLRKKKKKK